MRALLCWLLSKGPGCIDWFLLTDRENYHVHTRACWLYFSKADCLALCGCCLKWFCLSQKAHIVWEWIFKYRRMQLLLEALLETRKMVNGVVRIAKSTLQKGMQLEYSQTRAYLFTPLSLLFVHKQTPESEFPWPKRNSWIWTKEQINKQNTFGHQQGSGRLYLES